MHKHRPSLGQSWLWIGLVILINSLAPEPLVAQVVNGLKLPKNTETAKQNPHPQNVQLITQVPLPQVPRDQDIRPGPQDVQSPTPLPSPQLPPPLPPPEELLQPPRQQPAPESPAAAPGEVPESIKVTKFEVVGSTVFSQQRLAKELEPFTNRPISLAELFQARSAITQLYVDNGYITSGAFIPPQTLQAGIVKIQVVEGGLEDIQITGTKRLNPNYVRRRIARDAKAPLNRERLLESLQLLQLNPLIQNLSAELSAGSRPGVSLLEVRVTEAQTDRIQLAIDNGRVPSVGTFRRRVQVSEANLLGQGDSISLAYTNTDGSNALDASYVWPLNASNGTLALSYGTTSSNVIEPPFDEIDINSDSRYYEITLRQPISQSPSQELALGLTAARRESETSVLNRPFQLALGSDERGRTRISELQFFQEWTTRDSQQVLAARSQFTLGIDALNATINDDDDLPDSRFFAWRGQAQWVRLLAPDTLLIIRGDVQLADRPLVSLEQFSVGGLESVRGYRQDLLLTDNGAIASAEVRIPVLRASRIGGILQVTPFIDFGTAWNNSGRSNPDPNTLAAAGFGLRWQQGDRLTARLDWGIPLVDVDSRERTWQENGVYFSVQYNPF